MILIFRMNILRIADMDQNELLILINKLRDKKIDDNEFNTLKNVISRRSRTRGDKKKDVIMLTIEMIMISTVEISEYNTNKFILDRIINAKYKLGLLDDDYRKVPKQYRLQYESINECTGIDANSEQAFSKAETNAYFYFETLKRQKEIPEYYDPEFIKNSNPSKKSHKKKEKFFLF